jgi:hypothetical protein
MDEGMMAPIYFDTMGGRVSFACRFSRNVYRFYEGQPELNPVTNPHDVDELRQCPDLVEVTQIEGGRWVRRPAPGVRPRRTVMTSDTLAQPTPVPITVAGVESSASVQPTLVGNGDTHPLAVALAEEPVGERKEEIAEEPGVETPPVSPVLGEEPVGGVQAEPDSAGVVGSDDIPKDAAVIPAPTIKVRVAKDKKPKDE